MTLLRVASAQYPITYHEDWDAYAAHVANWFARAGDADLLLFPEYGSMELTSLLTEDEREDLSTELEAMQSLHDRFFALHAELARRHRVHVVAPTFPLRCGEIYRNVAHVFGPYGLLGTQEKLMMTRFERERWGIEGGGPPLVFEAPFGRFAVAVCYDSEFPLIVRRQIEGGAMILLVPSCTDGLSGYHRVRVSCQARALEGQCYVVQSPTVGDALWAQSVDINVGAAGVFAPSDRWMPNDGIVKLGELNEPGWVTCDLDLDLLEKVRREGQVFNMHDWPDQARVLGPLQSQAG